jgi:hypothetical protein
MNIFGWVLFGVSFFVFIGLWFVLLDLNQTRKNEIIKKYEEERGIQGEVVYSLQNIGIILWMLVTILSTGVGLYIIKNFP